MSIKTMQRVWTLSGQKGSALLLLLAIADNADDDGECWPGIEHLRKKTRMSERQTQRMLQYLDTTPELAIEWGIGRGGSNYFYVLTGLPDLKIQAIKRMVAQHNLDHGVEERVQKISAARREHPKGDKMTPLESEKGDILTPENGQKGDIFAGKGVIFDGKGDIAMSPEPINLFNQREEEPEESGANLDPSLHKAEEAWQMVAEQMRAEMNPPVFERYVKTLKPLGCANSVYRLGATDTDARNWAASRLVKIIAGRLAGAYNQPVQVQIDLVAPA